ncbi:hypothetical protein [Stenoxybacter acetivorans]|uniref:hypothetical protein n=1 Tax=Stenoxybacter acetivorans TaxID=422441 RepID=UPI00055A9FA1|nr:hypothetical protein [Stenoxybacter acetivorans]
MIGATIFGVWLLTTFRRQRSAFWESCVVIWVIIGVNALIAHAAPEINGIWLLSWGICWLFVFFSFWFMDVLCATFVGSVIFVVSAAVGYFYLSERAAGLAENFIKLWFG